MRTFMHLAFSMATASVLGATAAAHSADACGGTVFPLRTATEHKGPPRVERGSSPYIELTLDGKTGPFLIDYGASDSSIEQGIWAPKADDPAWVEMSTPRGSLRKYPLSGFNLPGWKSGSVNFLLLDKDIQPSGMGAQHGILGVDLFMNQTVEFHFEDAKTQHVVISDFPPSACPAVGLKKEGFKRIDQTGHWAVGTVAPDEVHNGPVVYIDFIEEKAPHAPAGIATWAQIDSGYEDNLHPFTVDINQAMLAKLNTLPVKPKPAGTVRINGCKKGTPYNAPLYELEGRILRVQDQDGTEILRLPKFHVAVKEDSALCGGIGPHQKPAAQLGASFLRAFGTTIFMGGTKEVWIKPPGP